MKNTLPTFTFVGNHAGDSDSVAQNAAEAPTGEELGAGDALEDAYWHGERLWKAALYWTAELPVFTLSPTLRTADEGNETTRSCTR